MQQRYTWVAPLYDLLSLEWPVYRIGRRLGVPLLRLRPGDTVLDVGCGTGLDFLLLARAVGAGTIVGFDSNPQMLAAAQRKVPAPAAGAGLLRHADATTMAYLRHDEPSLSGGADAVLFTYSLSLMRPWRQVWEQALALARPGARVVLVDMATPTRPARLSVATGATGVHSRVVPKSTLTPGRRLPSNAQMSLTFRLGVARPGLGRHHSPRPRQGQQSDRCTPDEGDSSTERAPRQCTQPSSHNQGVNDDRTQPRRPSSGPDN